MVVLSSVSGRSRSLNRFLWSAVTLGILLNLYFVSHLFYGQNSIRIYKELLLHRDEKSAELKGVISYNEGIENSLSLANDQYIDKDYLDELARSKLNYSSRDEKVIILKSASSSS